MPTKLVDIDIQEVSGVDKAANGKTFLIVKNANPHGTDTAKGGEKLHKSLLSRVVAFAKGLITDESNDSSAVDFNTAMAISQKQQEDWARDSKIYDGIWALRDAIGSIVDDETIEDKQAEVLQCLNQFFCYLNQNQVLKAGKKISGARMDSLKLIYSQLGELINDADANPANGDDDDTLNKGDDLMGKKHVEGCQCDTCLGVNKSADGLAALQKRMDDLEKRNQSLESQNKELESQVKKQADEAATSLYIKKAADFDKLGIKADEIGPVLKKMAEADPDGYAKLEAVLAAANEQVTKGALFNENGINGGTTVSSVEKRVESMAVELMKSGSLTKEQAIAKVYKDNPDMYKQYRDEMRGA